MSRLPSVTHDRAIQPIGHRHCVRPDSSVMKLRLDQYCLRKARHSLIAVHLCDYASFVDPTGHRNWRASSNNIAFHRGALLALGSGGGLDKASLLSNGSFRVIWVPEMCVASRPVARFWADRRTRFYRGRHYAAPPSNGMVADISIGRWPGLFGAASSTLRPALGEPIPAFSVRRHSDAGLPMDRLGPDGLVSGRNGWVLGWSRVQRSLPLRRKQGPRSASRGGEFVESNGQRLGVLVVGVGFLGAQRAAAVVASRCLRLVAVCDRDSDRAFSVARRHRVIDYTNYDDAIANPAVHTVIVATPHADHADQVRSALQAGKHVLCEKPLTVDADDARSLAAQADQLGLRLATGLNHRFYSPVRDAFSLIASSALGRVETVRAVIGHRAEPEFLSSWHTDVSRSGGGTLMDNGPHACDLIRGFLGEITSARGELHDGTDFREGCEVEAFASFQGINGGTAELQSSWVLETGYLTIDVIGASGYLKIETAPWRLTGRLADGRPVQRLYIADRVRERLFRVRHQCERSTCFGSTSIRRSLQSTGAASCCEWLGWLSRDRDDFRGLSILRAPARRSSFDLCRLLCRTLAIEPRGRSPHESTWLAYPCLSLARHHGKRYLH